LEAGLGELEKLSGPELGFAKLRVAYPRDPR
jgi:hypothetical protein